MDREKLHEMLSEVADGRLAVEEALETLKHLPFENLEFARVDLHRSLRTGFPEVIFGQGKTTEQIIEIAKKIAGHDQLLFATRLTGEAGRSLAREFPDGEYDPLARTFHLTRKPIADLGRGVILVVSAGTSDLPVAHEAALTARLMGNRVELLADVGVAGIHRLLEHREMLQDAAVLIVVAGMEGALPSVVGGLVDKPVIAVPTSVGYGASFSGVAALLGMLNSCAPGVTVVNIDNGFGAGFSAAIINKRSEDD